MTRNIADLKRLNNDRVDYSKISGELPLPNLVEIQTKSYEEFKEKGLDEVFKESFPIKNYTGTLSLDYVSMYFGEPKHSYLDCKAQELTYSAPIYVKLRLVRENGEIQEDDKVYMGDFPLMTNGGTFLINGAERVIVSQLVRSPGAYLRKEMKAGKYLYGADLIPSRGTWLQFESDKNDILSVRINRARKMHATILLKAIGIETEEDIVSLFGKNEALLATIGKEEDSKIKTAKAALVEIYRKMKPGEPITEEGTVKYLKEQFFDDKRYDLGRAGRYKYIKKLGIYNRLPNRILAEHLKDNDGNIRFTKGTKLSMEDVEALRNEEFFEKGAHTHKLNVNENLDNDGIVNIVRVYKNEKMKEVCPIIGTNLNSTSNHVTISDIIAVFSYFLNVIDGFGDTDDIDHLGNRRIRCVGELIQNQFRTGLVKMAKTVQQKMSISDLGNVKPKALINPRPLKASIREFFASSQLSQFMDQTNPIAELTNKRKLSALGPGGLNRDRATFEVRDIHYTHYGRICPIETPEGQNIGLISSLAAYAQVNEFGFIETPYRKVEHVLGSDGQIETIVTEHVDYLTADEEDNYIVAQANEKLIDNKYFAKDRVSCRKRADITEDVKENIDYMDISPKQIISVATALIPFLENDDAKRALMGSNMQRQAVPLLVPENAIVATGIERKIAYDSGVMVNAKEAGVVESVASDLITIKENDGTVRGYKLKKFERSNQGTCINQRPIVDKGEKVEKGQTIADGPATKNGELALGRNILIGFMSWEGYNYEDAILLSEKLVRDDVFTTIHIEEHEIEARDTRLGEEEITRDIPNAGEDALKDLDEDGIIRIGAEVNSGDILVGKVTPKGETELTPEERLLRAIFGEKVREVRDTSLKVPHGEGGVVVDVKIFTRENKDELAPGVNKLVRVYIAQKRKIGIGDKMAGRHGNKGVVSRVLPENDMPFMADGTPLEIVLNPLGVPSRMNIGQVLEVHLGLVCKELGWKIATPVFDGATEGEIKDLFREAASKEGKGYYLNEDGKVDGKIQLYDGRTGEPFENKVTVGQMYMIKLNHLVDDKIHARSTGPYSLVTQQPLGGKAQFGGQRFGEMEIWALEAYGASHILQEILTVKSDGVVGRVKTYESIVKGTNISEPGIPEAFKVLLKELQSLALDMKVLTENKEELSLKDLMESDYEDTPLIKERETREEVDIDKLAEEEVGKDNTMLDDEDIDINIDDGFDMDKDMFADDDEEIDTTVPDGDFLDDDFDTDEDEDKE